MLRVNHVSYTLARKPLLSDIHFQVAASEIYWLVGPNGVGKTTLLKILCGLITPTTGSILWEIDKNQQQSYFCYVGHRLAIDDKWTVLENSEYYAALFNNPTFPLQKCLENSGLWSLRHRLTSQLSAGQRQRLALLRLQISQAWCWILDEPAASLDAEGSQLLSAWINQHQQAGGAVIFTSHTALPVSAQIYTIKNSSLDLNRTLHSNE